MIPIVATVFIFPHNTEKVKKNLNTCLSFHADVMKNNFKHHLDFKIVF